MSKNSYQQPSPQTQDEALKIARHIQRPAQTKEQTKLIAQGIQQGIDLYKRQQKEKARALNKQRKQLAKQKAAQTVPVEPADADMPEAVVYRQHWLPWVLLLLTWLAIGFFLIVGHIR